jgi:hypothetical protein
VISLKDLSYSGCFPVKHFFKNILILLIFQMIFSYQVLATPLDRRFLEDFFDIQHPSFHHHIYLPKKHQYRQTSILESLGQMISQVEGACFELFQKKALIPDELQIIFVEDTEQMRALAQKRNAGIPPEWADGLAYPHENEIYIVIKPQLETTILHELVHIALFQIDSNRLMPKWLNEGLSIYLSEGIPFERGMLVNEAGMKKQLLSFHHIEHVFPKSDSQAQLAYAQSAHFVDHLIDQYGEKAFGGLIERLIDTARIQEKDQILDMDLAAIGSFGKSITELEKEWSKGLSSHWFIRWLALLGNGLLWGLLLLSFILIGYRHLQKRKGKIEKLKKNEQKLDKLFDEWETQIKSIEQHHEIKSLF